MGNVTPAQIHLAEHQAEALTLRARGWTYRRIGDHQGVHVATAQRRVRAALAATVQEPADELRTLEAHRLDGLFELAVAKAEGGSMAAIEAALKIQERRARLLGLDAPERRIVDIVTRDQWSEAMEELEAQIAAAETRRARVGVPGPHE